MNKKFIEEFESDINSIITCQKKTWIYLALKNGHIYNFGLLKSIDMESKIIIFSSCWINTEIVSESKNNLLLDYSSLESYSLEDDDS